MKTPCHIRTRLPRLLALWERCLSSGRPLPVPRWVRRLPGSWPGE
jgi:hypothetical protein